MLKHFINGVWTGDKLTGVKLNPCTGEEQSTYCRGDVDDVVSAVDLARKAQKSWRALGRVRRAEVLNKALQDIKDNADFYAGVISTETGKHLNESMAEVVESLHML